MTIRVALVIPTMDRGGAEKQLSLLARNLPADRFDVHVILLTRDGPRSSELRAAGIPVTLVGKQRRADPSAFWRLRRVLSKLKPDIVHTWLFAANSFGRAAAKMVGVRTIIASERSVDPWKRGSHFFIDRRLAQLTTAITTNSTAVRDFYALHGIDPELFRVIPNGIEPPRRSPISRADALERLSVPPERKLVLAIGRLCAQKRYRDLIWAAELLASAREDTTLVIIGDGPQSGELLRFRDAVSTPHNVRLAGARADVAELLPHADLFWLGSGYEGQSNALMEAMQAGIPVVATDIPGTRDLISDGQTGALVGVGDAADFARKSIALLDDPNRAAALAAAAREKIERDFSVANMVGRHAELYRGLTALAETTQSRPV